MFVRREELQGYRAGKEIENGKDVSGKKSRWANHAAEVDGLRERSGDLLGMLYGPRTRQRGFVSV